MASSTILLFAKNQGNFRVNDILGASVKLALISSAWTPDATVTGNSIFADISGNEISAAGGYSAGGIALTSMAVTAISGGYKFSSDDAMWTTVSPGIAAWRYGVLYVAGSSWGLTSPLIGYFIGDSAPANIPLTTAGGSLTVYCPTNGWFDSK